MRFLRLLRYLFQDVGRPIASPPFLPDPAAWPSDRVTVCRLGHATIFINFCGFTILTDPVFSARCGIRVWPFTFGPKRYFHSALRPRELPPLDLILLSHAHMDHLDKRSLRHLSRTAKVVTACGTLDLLRGMRFREKRELSWGETVQVTGSSGDLTITAYGLRHWGARYPWETQRSYNAYVLERAGHRLCFAGDTASTSKARHLGERGPIDLIMLPIAAYNPWIANHCTPEEAVQMADEARAKLIMPMHHQTFKLSYEPMDEPARRFAAAVPPECRAAGEIGEVFTLQPNPNS